MAMLATLPIEEKLPIMLTARLLLPMFRLARARRNIQKRVAAADLSRALIVSFLIFAAAVVRSREVPAPAFCNALAVAFSVAFRERFRYNSAGTR